MFQPLQTRKIFEEAVAQIADAVAQGSLCPGDRLPSERVLAAQMEISRPTLREAFKVLSDAGVIRVRSGAQGGAEVISDVVPVSLIERSVSVRVEEVMGILEARRALEPRVAQLAALRATDSDFAALQQTIDAQMQHITDRKLFSRHGFRFHFIMARATQNSTLNGFARSLLSRLSIARDVAFRDAMEPMDAIAIHQRTLHALMGADPDVIEEVMDEHLAFLERLWEEQSGRARIRRTPAFLLSKASGQGNGPAPHQPAGDLTWTEAGS